MICSDNQKYTCPIEKVLSIFDYFKPVHLCNHTASSELQCISASIHGNNGIQGNNYLAHANCLFNTHFRNGTALLIIWGNGRYTDNFLKCYLRLPPSHIQQILEQLIFHFKFKFQTDFFIHYTYKRY